MAASQLDLFDARPPAPVVIPPTIEEVVPEPDERREGAIDTIEVAKEEGQIGLFGDALPEPEAPEAGPIKRLLVHFEKLEDVVAFAALVGQHVTTQTRVIAFPPIVTNGSNDERS